MDTSLKNFALQEPHQHRKLERWSHLQAADPAGLSQ
jgi:hypothetical protein